MLVLHPNRAHMPEKPDPLGRSVVGWSPTMSPAELYEACRGCWKVGERGKKERFILLVADDVVRGAMEVSGYADHSDHRTSFTGTMLGPGHPVFDAYVNKPDPCGGNHRNPVRYLPNPPRSCGCGCGTTTERDFVPGHDQRAVHDRIKRVFGSVSNFLLWFDQQFPVSD